jgi:hypothetical protein
MLVIVKTIDKVRRSFLWKGRKEVNDDWCMVIACKNVARSIDLGGLEVLGSLIYKLCAGCYFITNYKMFDFFYLKFDHSSYSKK